MKGSCDVSRTERVTRRSTASSLQTFQDGVDHTLLIGESQVVVARQVERLPRKTMCSRGRNTPDMLEYWRIAQRPEEHPGVDSVKPHKIQQRIAFRCQVFRQNESGHPVAVDGIFRLRIH